MSLTIERDLGISLMAQFKQPTWSLTIKQGSQTSRWHGMRCVLKVHKAEGHRLDSYLTCTSHLSAAVVPVLAVTIVHQAQSKKITQYYQSEVYNTYKGAFICRVLLFPSSDLRDVRDSNELLIGSITTIR